MNRFAKHFRHNAPLAKNNSDVRASRKFSSVAVAAIFLFIGVATLEAKYRFWVPRIADNSQTYTPATNAFKTSDAERNRQSSDFNKSDDLIQKAKQKLLIDFYDPVSAQFRNVRINVREKDKKTVVCGEVNGKNRYGGYVGFRPFYFDGEESNILNVDDERYEGNAAFRELAIMSFKFLGCTDSKGRVLSN